MRADPIIQGISFDLPPPAPPCEELLAILVLHSLATFGVALAFRDARSVGVSRLVSLVYAIGRIRIGVVAV